MIHLQGIRDRVVIKKDTPKETTAGGIIIPDACREKPITGTVLSVGPGEISASGYRLPMQCRVGDKAVFHKYSGMNVMVDGEEFYIIRENEVLATYSEE